MADSPPSYFLYLTHFTCVSPPFCLSRLHGFETGIFYTNFKPLYTQRHSQHDQRVHKKNHLNVTTRYPCSMVNINIFSVLYSETFQDIVSASYTIGSTELISILFYKNTYICIISIFFCKGVLAVFGPKSAVNSGIIYNLINKIRKYPSRLY